MRRSHCLIVALFTGALVLAPSPSPAQEKPVVTIDGKKTPDRIPDWILWREVFGIATTLAEQQPDAGKDFWVGMLGLTEEQMHQVIGSARVLEQEETAAQKDQGPPVDTPGRVLQLRETLRTGIGETAYQRINSFARINIAPGVTVGTYEKN